MLWRTFFAGRALAGAGDLILRNVRLSASLRLRVAIERRARVLWRTSFARCAVGWEEPLLALRAGNGR